MTVKFTALKFFSTASLGIQGRIAAKFYPINVYEENSSVCEVISDVSRILCYGLFSNAF